jgi:hypothetical protein
MITLGNGGDSMAMDADGLLRAAESGDRATILLAVRDRLIAELSSPECPGIAGVAKELRALLAELDVLGIKAEVTALDRLADGVTTDINAYRTRRGA